MKQNYSEVIQNLKRAMKCKTNQSAKITQWEAEEHERIFWHQMVFDNGRNCGKKGSPS